MTEPRPLRSLTLVAAAVGVAALVRYARRELNEPIDRSGAGVPLAADQATRAPVSDSRIVARPEEPEWVRDLAGWVPAAPRSVAGRIVAYLWASPSTLGGLIVALLSGARPQVRDGVLLFTGARGPLRMAMERSGYAATTLGHVIVARHEPTASLMAHELAHTRQAERLGPLMGPVYWYLLARYGYARHPMERAARIAGRSARHHSDGQTRPTRDGIRT